jgi:hypothetical protein
MTFIIGTPHTHNSGYYRNDDRLSGGTLAEGDVQTCPHCQKVINMQEWAKAPVQNFCLKCMKPACNSPECQDCRPFIRQIDLYTDAVVKLQAFIKMAGLDPEVPRVIIIPE